jgi:ADP-ribose pyrophosphatase YjhB (NUDIX family)
VREVAEETGLVVEVGALLGEVRRAGPAGITYRIEDFLVTVRGSSRGSGTSPAGPMEPVAGDDALQVAWVPIDEVSGYPLSAGLLRTLRAWAVIPRKA